MTSSRILIFANGLLPDRQKARSLLRPGDVVVCADGGTAHALSLGLTPAVVVGDLDSLNQADRRNVLAAGSQLLEHPVDKDETDLQLALDYALQRKPGAIVVVGALGGRIDQTLANISLLADPRCLDLDCRLDDGLEELFFCRDHAEVQGKAGDIVSLIPWGPPVVGVQARGFRWPLHGETLLSHVSRGISNELLGDSARVQIESGLLLIVHRRQA